MGQAQGGLLFKYLRAMPSCRKRTGGLDIRFILSLEQVQPHGPGAGGATVLPALQGRRGAHAAANAQQPHAAVPLPQRGADLPGLVRCRSFRTLVASGYSVKVSIVQSLTAVLAAVSVS